MLSQAELALATAKAFIDNATEIMEPGHVAERKGDILNFLALASRKILEAEKIDPAAKLKTENSELSISQIKAISLEIQAHVMFWSRNYTQALNVIDQSIRLFPDFARAYHLKGVILAAMMRKPESIAALNKAIELDPQDIDFHQALEEVKSISGTEQAVHKTGSMLFNIATWYMRAVALGAGILALISIFTMFNGDPGGGFAGLFVAAFLWLIFGHPALWVLDKFRS